MRNTKARYYVKHVPMYDKHTGLYIRTEYHVLEITYNGGKKHRLMSVWDSKYMARDDARRLQGTENEADAMVTATLRTELGYA